MDGKHQEWVTFLEYFMHTFFSDPGGNRRDLHIANGPPVADVSPNFSPRSVDPKSIQVSSLNEICFRFDVSQHFPWFSTLKKKKTSRPGLVFYHDMFFWYVCRIQSYLFVIVHFLMVALWSFEACTTTSLQVSSYRKISNIYKSVTRPHVFFFEGWISPKLKEFVFQFLSPKPPSSQQAEGPRISPRDPARRKEEGQLLAVWPPIRQRGKLDTPRSWIVKNIWIENHYQYLYVLIFISDYECRVHTKQL